jgi:hypothetical protein
METINELDIYANHWKREEDDNYLRLLGLTE